MDSQLSLFGFESEPVPEKEEKEKSRSVKKKKDAAADAPVNPGGLWDENSDTESIGAAEAAPGFSVPVPEPETPIGTDETGEATNTETVPAVAEPTVTLKEDEKTMEEDDSVADRAPVPDALAENEVSPENTDQAPMDGNELPLAEEGNTDDSESTSKVTESFTPVPPSVVVIAPAQPSFPFEDKEDTSTAVSSGEETIPENEEVNFPEEGGAIEAPDTDREIEPPYSSEPEPAVTKEEAAEVRAVVSPEEETIPENEEVNFPEEGEAIEAPDTDRKIAAEIETSYSCEPTPAVAKEEAAEVRAVVSAEEETIPEKEEADLPEEGEAIEAPDTDREIAAEIETSYSSEPEPVVRKEETPEAPAVFSTFGKKGRKSFKEIDAEVDLIQVPSDEVLFSRQYYPISQVAKWFRVNNSLLRFWENEFDILKPRKNRKGDRLFRPDDIKNLQIIYYLLRQKKYTIAGAKKYIKNNRKTVDVSMKIIQTLNDFKHFLLELKANAERP